MLVRKLSAALGLALCLLAPSGRARAIDCAAVEPRAAGPGDPVPIARLDPGVDARTALARGLGRLQAGDPESAAALWRAAVALAEDDPDAGLEADARLWLAQAYLRLGHLGRALFELERADARSALAPDAARAAGIHAAEADVRLALGQRARARELYERAIDEAGAAGDPAATAHVLLGFGNLLLASGEAEAAERRHVEAAERAERAGEPALALRARASVLRARLAADASADVTADLAQTAAAVDALPATTAQAELWLHLARTATELRERTADRGSGVRAAEWSARAAALATRLGDARLVSFAEGQRGRLYELDGRSSEAAELTRRALFAAQTAGAPEAVYRWQWQLARLRRAGGDAAGATDAYRDAVATLNRLRAETPLGRGGLDERFDRAIRPVFFGFADVLLERAAATEDASARRALLVEARDAVEELKTAELRDYFEDACLAASRITAPDAIPHTAVIYPIVLEDRTELIVSTPTDMWSHSVEIPRDALEREVSSFRALLEKRTTRQYRRPAARLYDLLFRPIEARLAEQDLRTLVFVPDGILRTVPMGALWDREEKQFLIEKYPVAITPGLTLTDPRSIDRENVELLLAGLTESVQGYPALPHVEREAAAVTESFAGRSLIDEAFVVERMRAELAERPFGIVHIASHGEFHADGEESFLLTHDGRLGIGQLAELVELSRFREAPLELLTLSACETAAGDERAALGLAGVAVRAGARSALATLWPVNDHASYELVSEFYRQLSDPGVSRAEALRRAQVRLIGVRRWRHPGYWAPFLMISNWL